MQLQQLTEKWRDARNDRRKRGSSSAHINLEFHYVQSDQTLPLIDPLHVDVANSASFERLIEATEIFPFESLLLQQPRFVSMLVFTMKVTIMQILFIWKCGGCKIKNGQWRSRE